MNPWNGFKQFWCDTRNEFGLVGAIGIIVTSPITIPIILTICGIVIVRKDIWPLIKVSFATINGCGKVLWMSKSKESVYVIGFNGHVELRICKSAPKAIVTNLERDAIQSEPIFTVDKNGRTRLRWKKFPRKLELSNVIHTGGRVLKTMSCQEFHNLCRINVHSGRVYKLTKIEAAKILRK